MLPYLGIIHKGILLHHGVQSCLSQEGRNHGVESSLARKAETLLGAQIRQYCPLHDNKPDINDNGFFCTFMLREARLCSPYWELCIL